MNSRIFKNIYIHMKNSHIFMWEAVECSDLFISFTNISLRTNQALGSVLGFEW